MSPISAEIGDGSLAVPHYFRMQLGHALLYALEICFKSEWVIPHPQI